METDFHPRYQANKCPRCERVFTCMLSAKCWCMNYQLSDQEIEYLKHKYDDCLCEKCIKEITNYRER